MSAEKPAPEEDLQRLTEQFQRALASGAYADATDAVGDMFSLAGQWCEQNPSRDFELTVAAGQYEESADWSGAEAAYYEILSLPGIDCTSQYKAHSDLAGLYRLLGRDSEALDHARQATSAARLADSPMLLAMALRGEARRLIRSGHLAEAGKCIAEALAAIDDDSMYNQIRAGLLTLRAECAVRNHDIAAAERDLEQAFAMLQPLAGVEIAAGVHNDLAHWWSATARVRAARDDREGAVTASREAVSRSKHVASLPQAQNVYTKAIVADMLQELADALLACDRPEDAAATLEEREEILSRVGQPDKQA